jgi:hypothetical protein
MRTAVQWGAVCMLCVSLSACVSTRDRLLRAGYDPAYADGYADGEQSGSKAGGNPYAPFTKNTHRFDEDPQYRQGWQDGFNVGKGQYEASSRLVQ